MNIQEILYLILVVSLSLYALMVVFTCIGMIRLWKKMKTPQPSTFQPTVSVLVSCKNEEEDLPMCLRALKELDYPFEKLDFWIVDDRSTDNTDQVIKSFSETDFRFHYLSTQEFETKLKAKARGIDFATKHAKGDWLFITDADGEPRPSWIKETLSYIDENTGVIGGMLCIKDDSLVGMLERNTWGYTLPFAAGMAGWNAVFASIGPNMAVKREAYERMGGLEKADFKIAEDLAIFNIAKEAGYEAKFIATKNTTVHLKSVPTIWHILSQLRRWLRGGFEQTYEYWAGLSGALGICFIMSVAFCLSFITGMESAWWLFGIKCLLDSLLVFYEKKLIQGQRYLRYLPIIWFFNLFIFIWLPLSFLVAPKVHWKGKDYDIKY